MSEKQWTIIYLTPNYLEKKLVTYRFDDPNEQLQVIGQETVTFVRQNDIFGYPQKAYSTRTQCLIEDTIKNWFRQIQTENTYLPLQNRLQVRLLLHHDVLKIQGLSGVIKKIKDYTGQDFLQFNPLEHARQSFIGSKLNLGNIQPETPLCNINLHQSEITIVTGDLYRQEEIIQLDYGIVWIAETISELLRKSDLEAIVMFTKANLYRHIDRIKLFSKPQIITFDDISSHLLRLALSVDDGSQRFQADLVKQLCYKICDSGFTYLENKKESFSMDSLLYASVQIILLGFIVEGLGASHCYLEQESRIKGLIWNELASSQPPQNHHDHLSGNAEYDFMDSASQINLMNYLPEVGSHYSDWQASARKCLTNLSSQSYVQACQLVNLADKFFDRSHGFMHMWTGAERKLLWLSAFFSLGLSQLPFEAALAILKQLYGIDYQEAQQVACIVFVAQANNLSDKSRYLDYLPAESRQLARKLASIVQLIKALDVTGRAAVDDIRLEAKPKVANQVVLKVVPRLNPEPELIQVNILKKQFENHFDHKLDVEVALFD